VTFALDSSVMVAAVCAWHDDHASAVAAIEQRLAGRHRLVSPIHAVTETYAVLTRLPAPHRLSPADAWALVSANFVEVGAVVGLPVPRHLAVIRELAAAGTGGGRTYDALIAGAAHHAKVDELLTFNVKHFDEADGLRIIGLGR
jgi:predicted nucleic acid-binding protein